MRSMRRVLCGSWFDQVVLWRYGTLFCREREARVNEQELTTALEHDQAQKAKGQELPRFQVLAAECFRNAALASRGAECAMTVCNPPGIKESRAAAQLAIMALEQALTLLTMLEQPNE